MHPSRLQHFRSHGSEASQGPLPAESSGNTANNPHAGDPDLFLAASIKLRTHLCSWVKSGICHACTYLSTFSAGFPVEVLQWQISPVHSLCSINPHSKQSNVCLNTDTQSITHTNLRTAYFLTFVGIKYVCDLFSCISFL